MIELLPSICQLKILQSLSVSDIVACKSVSHAWRVMVTQLWSKAVTHISIPGDFTGSADSAVSERKCQQILSNIEDQLKGIEAKLDNPIFEQNHHDNLLILMNNRFPALQNLCLRTSWPQFDGQLLSGFTKLRSLRLCFELCDRSEQFRIDWNIVLPRFRFLRELYLKGVSFVLSQDEICSMPGNLFVSLEVLSFTDIKYGSEGSICLFIKRFKNLRRFEFCGFLNASDRYPDWFTDIAVLIDSLEPTLTELSFKGVVSDYDSVCFSEIINRLHNLKEGTLYAYRCYGPGFSVREMSTYPPVVNVALRKLILFVANEQENVIDIIADAPFQLVYLEMGIVVTNDLLDGYLKRLILKQKQLEVLKLKAGKDMYMVEGSFLKELVLHHSKIKVAQFSSLTFTGLPKHLQAAIDILSDPSSVAGLPAENRADPVELQFCSCSFGLDQTTDLPLSINPFALNYIHVKVLTETEGQ